MFHAGNRTCVQFRAKHDAIDHKEWPRSLRPPPRQSKWMRRNKRNATFCGRGYYLANVVMQARYEKIINGKRFNVCYINKILSYTFKTIFIDGSRISSDKYTRMGILEYFVTLSPKCATACAPHHQGRRFPKYADLPLADRDICRTSIVRSAFRH